LFFDGTGPEFQYSVEIEKLCETGEFKYY